MTLGAKTRARYLEALGVVVYRRRPDAAEARADAAAASAAASDGPGFAPTVAVSPIAADVRAARRPLDAARDRNAAPATAVAALAPTDARASSPGRGGGAGVAPGPLAELRLACWQPASPWLVLDSVARTQPPGAERVQLLANILRALGGEPRLAGAELIEWPVTANGVDADGARVLIEMFLQGRRAASPFRWLLAMGEAPVRLLAEPGFDADWRSLWGRQRMLAGDVCALFLPGLGDMLADPRCKAATWAALRTLAATAAGVPGPVAP